MEVNRNGRGCPRRTLPTTAKTTKQKQPKTLANLMEIKGNGRGCPKVPYTKQKHPKPPTPPKTSKSDGNP